MSTIRRRQQIIVVSIREAVNEFHFATHNLFLADTYEILCQIFTRLENQTTPFELADWDVIQWERLRTDVISIKQDVLHESQKAAYALLMQVYTVVKEYNLYDPHGKLNVMPFVMVGSDVALSYFPF